MKHLFTCILLLTFLSAFSQENKVFQLEGRLVNSFGNPIGDAYIINYRNLVKYTSRTNGVFNIWVQPTDSLIISHISYLRKVVTVHELLVNPVVHMQLDSVNLNEVNISPNQKTDREKALDNIESIKFDFRPKSDEEFTKSERSKELMISESRVFSTEAASISLFRFSPSTVISNLKEKRKKKKKAREYDSTKEKE